MRILVLVLCLACVATKGRRFEYGKIMKSKKTLDLKREILHLLGLERQPRPSLRTRLLGKRLSAPRFMMELYKILSATNSTNDIDSTTNMCCANNSSADQNVIGADTIVSFLHRVKEKRAKMSPLHMSYNFELNSGPEDDEEIIACELRLFKDPIPTRGNHDWQNTTYQVTLNQVVKPGEIIHALQTITLRSWESGWQVFDVSKAARIWKKVPDSNQGLELTVKTFSGETVTAAHAGFVGFHGDTAKRPFMVTFFREYSLNDVQRRYRRSRVRRSSVEASRNLETRWTELAGYASYNSYQGGRRSCEKRPLYVSFRDLGWQNWIIAPEGYSAYFCHGECSFPLNSHMNATNHAIVQTLVHLMNPDTVPEPCCAPTELSAISVLYFDDNSNVVLKKYKKMVVRACGCH